MNLEELKAFSTEQITKWNCFAVKLWAHCQKCLVCLRCLISENACVQREIQFPRGNWRASVRLPQVDSERGGSWPEDRHTAAKLRVPVLGEHNCPPIAAHIAQQWGVFPSQWTDPPKHLQREQTLSRLLDILLSPPAPCPALAVRKQ